MPSRSIRFSASQTLFRRAVGRVKQSILTQVTIGTFGLLQRARST